MTRVLLTTTSFQDTPGGHHQLLADTGWDIIRARGPLFSAAEITAFNEVATESRQRRWPLDSFKTVEL